MQCLGARSIFKKVPCTNGLLYDVHAPPGIEIIAVRVTKPRIPEAVRQAFENIATESTKIALAAERQKVTSREAEGKRRNAVMAAEKLLSVAVIEADKLIAEKEAERNLSAIEVQGSLSSSLTCVFIRFFEKRMT